MPDTYFDKIYINSLPMQPEIEFRDSSFAHIWPYALWLVEITNYHDLA